MNRPALRVAAFTVLAVGEAPAQPPDAHQPLSSRDVYLEMEVTPREVYVQAQVTCVLRIYRAAEFFEARLSAFEPDGTVLHRLGRDSKHSRIIDGRRFEVIERRFAVFPQASGRLMLPAIRLDARIAGADPTPTRGREFDPGRQVRVETEPVEVTVKPRPDVATSPWLPARALTLTEEWPESPPRIVAGKSVVWTVSLHAAGLGGEQLPLVDISGVTGARVYPDLPSVTTRTDANAVHGERIQPIALVAGAAGALELPELRVEWWDVEADASRVALIPARTVVVEPSPSQAHRSEAAPARVPAANAGRAWQGISAALAAAWLVTLAALVRARRRQRRYDPDGPDRRPSAEGAPHGASAARRGVLDACNRSDSRAAREALLSWARIAWPGSPPLDLIDLAPRVDDRLLAEAILALDSALWSSRNAAWDGAALADRLPRRLGPRAVPDRPARTDGLPSLRPA